MQRIVLKFGGTSVSNKKNWQNISKIIKNHLANNIQPIVVCSALSKISDSLDEAITLALVNQHTMLEQEIITKYSELANSLAVSIKIIDEDIIQLKNWLKGIALIQEASPRIKAQIMSLGEIILTRLGHNFLNNQGIECTWMDARELLIIEPSLTQDNYLSAYCSCEPDTRVIKKFNFSNTAITQGFIAANKKGETVLLGRGGSDTTAAILAAKIKAKRCEIWTDVTGIYTANPHIIPNARLLKQLHYDEAQEIASQGAKVLHPNCLLPVKKANIPMLVKCTNLPQHIGTLISPIRDRNAPAIKSVLIKHNICLISIDSLTMWKSVGFLASVFTILKQFGLSVDLISTSEFNITFSLDNLTTLPKDKFEQLMQELNFLGSAKLIRDCSVISLIGYQIPKELSKLLPVYSLIEQSQIYLMSLASNELNLSFVIPNIGADKIYRKIHAILIENNPHNYYYSKSFEEEFNQTPSKNISWWQSNYKKLLAIATKKSPCYVYNLEIVKNNIRKLLALKSIDKFFYAVKANPNPQILTILNKEDIGFECVSIDELKHVYNLFPKIKLNKLLFTPNFAAKYEYEFALKLGCIVTVDSLYPLQQWPHLFQNQKVLIRIDTGSGSGHHKYVETGGSEAKFGIPLSSVDSLQQIAADLNLQVYGLHAHLGSGILTPNLWQQTAMQLLALLPEFPDLTVINLGGGLGIAEKPTEKELDLLEVDALLTSVKNQFKHISFWLEPGRFYVAEAGVILAKVTQLKTKDGINFVGIETGMNSLIRPALYDSYHEIVNLSALSKEKDLLVQIVGPICESADVLGKNRLFPATKENDIILIANTGAYGHCMSSYYNLREPAKEIIFTK